MTIISGGVVQPFSAQSINVVKGVATFTAAAGVTTLDVDIPAGAYLIDIYLCGIALWNAGTSATGIVGDVADPNGFFAAVDLKATDLLAGETISISEAGGKAGAYIAANQCNMRYYPSAETITLEVTTVGVTSTGETHMIVVYAVPQTVVASTYVAT